VLRTLDNVNNGVPTLVGGHPTSQILLLFNNGTPKSQKAGELNIQVAEAVSGVQSGKYKSSYKASKALGLSKETVARRVKGGLSRAKARQTQQLLTQTQEETLLKWIKCLAASGYAPSHRILREVADEIRTERCSPSLSNTPLPAGSDVFAINSALHILGPVKACSQPMKQTYIIFGQGVSSSLQLV